MFSRFTSRSLLKPLLYASTMTGGFTYIAFRSRDLPVPAPSAAVRTPPKFPKFKTRDEQTSDLKNSGAVTSSPSPDDIYDLLVIGGGATGAGIALDAVTRGLKVALVERDDFSCGTSSKSTKLVHGGVRYLEKAVWNLDYSQYALVKEALRERKCFMDIAPHLSSWMPVMLPLQKWYQAPYFWAGTKFYDFLAGSEGIENSYFLTRRKTLEAFPMLKDENLIGALVYYDGQHNDSRMNISLAMTAALYGATTVNHLEVTGLEKDATGRLTGARVRDLISDRDGNGNVNQAEEFVVRARGIINATGPFVDAIHQMDDPKTREIVAPSSGVHVVLPGYFSPDNMGLIDPSSSDGRVIFFLPWEGSTIAGTTDRPCGISKNPVPEEEDINWILNEIRGYLTPNITIRRSDILAAWSGIRPLVRDLNATNTESLVRNHLITISDSGLLTCVGGKWTTYRQMAEETVDIAIKSFNLSPRPLTYTPDISGLNLTSHAPVFDGKCQTQNVRLVGAHGFSKTLFVNLIQQFGLDVDVAKHLAHSYGDRAWDVAAMSTPTDRNAPLANRISPNYSFIDGEIRHAINNEYAQTAVDVLARRTRLSFLNVQAALEALPRVIDVMGDELRWSAARKEVEWADTVRFLESMGLPANKFGITMEEALKARAAKNADERTVRKLGDILKESSTKPGLPRPVLGEAVGV
ncbi:mitochondrial glycerol-3-phosphate dehydrogenase [Pseudogymnoascus australis]